MENLVGRRFTIEDKDYAIVDVRNISGDTMVYAEPTGRSAGPGRAAFRYVDIEPRLEQNAEKIA